MFRPSAAAWFHVTQQFSSQATNGFIWQQDMNPLYTLNDMSVCFIEAGFSRAAGMKDNAPFKAAFWWPLQFSS